MPSELILRYHGRSTFSEHSLDLATTGEGVFFDGFAEHPAVCAQALLCVARVAATRFFVPANMIAARIRAADPVVTAEPGRLRFESFSQCCGVHARLDMLPDGLDARASEPGTTNVDFGDAAREALQRITRRDPLRLTVGAESVKLQTLERTVIERRVPLPDRWVRGFGEVQVAVKHPAPALRLSAIPAQRFLRDLPRGRAGQRTYWALPSDTTVRLVPGPTPGAACVAAPGRLRVLEPLARYGQVLTAYVDPAAPQPSSVVWTLDMPGCRLSVALSPDWQRGFSGEGGLLIDLTSPVAKDDAHLLRVHLDGEPRFSTDDALARTSLSQGRCQAALTWLGIHGELGHDLPDDEFFWRRLPFPAEALAAEPPRLRDAQALVAAGAVTEIADHTFIVVSKGQEYRALVIDADFRCTCPWVAKHGTSRGPCKHVLAAMIADAEGRDARGQASTP